MSLVSTVKCSQKHNDAFYFSRSFTLVKMEISQENYNFYTILENDIRIEIPPHIKNAFW